MVINFILPIAKSDIETWRKCRWLLRTIGLSDIVNFITDECRINFGVIGNKEDCTAIGQAAWAAKNLNVIAYSEYIQRVLFKMLKNGGRKSVYSLDNSPV